MQRPALRLGPLINEGVFHRPRKLVQRPLRLVGRNNSFVDRLRHIRVGSKTRLTNFGIKTSNGLDSHFYMLYCFRYEKQFSLQMYMRY